MPEKQKANILLAVPDHPDKKDEVIAAQCAEITGLRNENTLLRQKIDLLIRQVFGSKSEQLDPAQLELLLGGSEDESKKRWGLHGAGGRPRILQGPISSLWEE